MARLPQTVVDDRGDRVIAWLAPGTDVQWWALKDGADPRTLPAADRFTAPIVSRRRIWEETSVLRVLPLDAPYSVLHFWDAQGTFGCWYINFERPKIRRRFGLETVDLVLDLVLLPDGSHYWKDEDEVGPAIAAGWITEDEAASARAAGEEILSDFELWLEELEDWRSFQPDPQWVTPHLS